MWPQLWTFRILVKKIRINILLGLMWCLSSSWWNKLLRYVPIVWFNRSSSFPRWTLQMSDSLLIMHYWSYQRIKRLLPRGMPNSLCPPSKRQLQVVWKMWLSKGFILKNLKCLKMCLLLWRSPNLGYKLYDMHWSKGLHSILVKWLLVQWWL